MKTENKDIYLMTRDEYQKLHGRKHGKCQYCGKYYNLPYSIFAPRDEICFTCELVIGVNWKLYK